MNERLSNFGGRHGSRGGQRLSPKRVSAAAGLRSAEHGSRIPSPLLSPGAIASPRLIPVDSLGIEPRPPPVGRLSCFASSLNSHLIS
ncbi:hypothetical protein NL676_020757 [Syzygium grande]|nr:hypothetical protein NL676_020757 [Syzygium grande]